MASKTINEETTSRDILVYKSDLEDIDFALYNFVNEGLDLSTEKNTGFEKVPVVWAGSERAQNIKNDEIDRDDIGMVTLPIIVIERTGVKKEMKKRGIPFAMVDPRGDLKGGFYKINKVINQDKTSNFANADAARLRRQVNFPTYRKKKNEKVVYDTLTIPIPIYVDVEYKITLRTEYQQQMNDMLVPFVRVSNAHKRVIIGHNSNAYEAFISEEYGMENNVSKYETNERKYETTLTMNVLGYLIGDGKNQSQPRVVRRENPVQIRLARERIIMGDEDGEFRF